MKLAEIFENKSAKLDITVKHINTRYFFEATLKVGSRNWLNKNDDSIICEATVDVNDDECYLNHIYSRQQNNGAASELLAYILHYFSKLGFKKFKAYVETSNIAPKGILRKFGFIESGQTRFGSYWVLKVN